MKLSRSNKWKQDKWRQQGRVCPLCRRPIGPSGLFSELVNIDHIRPVSHGGGNQDWNLQLVHKRCNDLKADNCLGCEACEGGPEAYLLWRARNPNVGRR